MYKKLLTMLQGVTILRPLVAYSFIVGNKRQKTLSQAPSFETTINVQVEIRIYITVNMFLVNKIESSSIRKDCSFGSFVSKGIV